MSVYEALSTTRAMRRMKLDPIPVEVRPRILDAAIRAPSGGSSQRWRFVRADASGGSIFPAIWSAMLAARADGVGSTLTTILDMILDEVDALLGVPTTADWRRPCRVALGYPSGRWGVAARQSEPEVAAPNGWNGPLGFAVTSPLWSGEAG